MNGWAGAGASSPGTRPPTRPCSARCFPRAPQKDLVWIGNWGDGERAQELHDFLIEPARQAKLDGTVHGVRYPAEALDRLAATGLAYQGWLPNADAPEAFARHRMTIHVPRRPYVEALPGIPTIRVFEALACGIPIGQRALAGRGRPVPAGTGFPDGARHRRDDAASERNPA